MSADLPLVKDVCRQIARNPARLAMIQAGRDWPRARVRAGAYVVFEEIPVPLNGQAVVVARLLSQDHHYVGRAVRLVQRGGVRIQLDDGTLLLPREFALRGPVVVVAQ